ncbi:hypothetical protein FKP32DRAFT_1208961 [Trametes sanguinea]|nr:hypothetical protein FKP32DRAFT_1208961 [Trametes sanguinea]
MATSWKSACSPQSPPSAAGPLTAMTAGSGTLPQSLLSQSILDTILDRWYRSALVSTSDFLRSATDVAKQSPPLLSIRYEDIFDSCQS